MISVFLVPFSPESGEENSYEETVSYLKQPESSSCSNVAQETTHCKSYQLFSIYIVMESGSIVNGFVTCISLLLQRGNWKHLRKLSVTIQGFKNMNLREHFYPARNILTQKLVSGSSFHSMGFFGLLCTGLFPCFQHVLLSRYVSFSILPCCHPACQSGFFPIVHFFSPFSAQFIFSRVS